MNKIVKNYVTQLNVALNDKLLNTELIKSANLISNCIRQNGYVYVAGNGGSAAISNHLLCDFSKGIEEKTNYSPRVISLSNSPELITAISNDSDFSNIEPEKCDKKCIVTLKDLKSVKLRNNQVLITC